MIFETELFATTQDGADFGTEFAKQLAELGGAATPLTEPKVVRVDTGTKGEFFFECRQQYRIELDEVIEDETIEDGEGE